MESLSFYLLLTHNNNNLRVPNFRYVSYPVRNSLETVNNSILKALDTRCIRSFLSVRRKPFQDFEGFIQMKNK